MEDRALGVKRSESPIHFLQLPFSQHKYKIISTIAVIIIGLSITALIHYGLRQNFASACFITAAGLAPFAFVAASLSMYRLITSPSTLDDKKTTEDIEIPQERKPSLEGKNIEKKQPAAVEDHNYLHGSHVEKEVAEVVLGEEFDPDLESFVEENRNDGNLKPLTDQEKPSLVFQEIEKESDTVQAVFDEEKDQNREEDIKVSNESVVVQAQINVQDQDEAKELKNTPKIYSLNSFSGLSTVLINYVFDYLPIEANMSNLAFVSKKFIEHGEKAVVRQAKKYKYTGDDKKEASQYLHLYDLMKNCPSILANINISHDLNFEEKIAKVLGKLRSSPNIKDILYDALIGFVKENNIKYVKSLLFLGADQNIKEDHKSDLVRNAINLGILNRNSRILKMLLERGAQVESEGQSALYNALKWMQLLRLTEDWGEEIIQLLCDYKADPNMLTTNGKRPLHSAAKLCYPRIVNLFLLKYNAQVDQLDGDGNTPLGALLIANERYLLASKGPDDHDSVQQRFYRTVEVLIERGANLNIQNSCHRSTPLHITARIGNFTLVRVFLENEAQVNLIDAEGNSPLILAIKSCASSKDELDIKAIVTLLLEKNADPNIQDSDGNTALHYAAKAGYYTMVESLLAHHANIDEVNYQNDTPWSLAYKEGENRVAELLLSRGAQRRFIAY